MRNRGFGNLADLILIQELIQVFLYADKKAVTKLTGRKQLIHNND